MKLLSKLAFIILLSFGQFVSAQNLEDFKKIEVAKYYFKPTKEFKLLTVPSSFGRSQISNASILDSLKDKKITSVRLVYTKYQESESFDQEQLNKKRVANLVASNPKLFSNACIKWYRVEQTTEDSFQAKSLFHGFYILYQNKAPQRDYAISDKLLNANGITTQVFKIENSKEMVITGKEGTKIRIQPNCFLDENKKPYKGVVKMEVKEAISMESIILGNLVTMADGNALESGGMIYIDAKTIDGKALTLNPNKPLEVSVAAKEVKPDMKLWEAQNNGKFMNWTNPRDMLEKNDDAAILKKNTVLRSTNRESVDLDVDGVIEGLITLCSENSNNSYYYRLYDKDTLRVQMYKKGNMYYDILEASKTYDISKYNNTKTPLPKPFSNGKDCFTPVFYKNNRLDYIGKFPAEEIREMVYKFNFKEMGNWANIDCLASDKRTQPVNFSATILEKEIFEKVSMYLIFKDKKIFIPGYKSEKYNGYGFSHGDYEIPRLPVGANATVLCIAYKNDKPYYALQNIVISEKQEVILKPVASSDDAIKKLIADSF